MDFTSSGYGVVYQNHYKFEGRILFSFVECSYVLVKNISDGFYIRNKIHKMSKHFSTTINGQRFRPKSHDRALRCYSVSYLELSPSSANSEPLDLKTKWWNHK